MPRKKVRKSTESFFEMLEGDSKGTAIALRDLVRATAPHLTETLMMGVPTWVGNDVVVYLAEYTRHFNLGFRHGAELHDSSGLLEGTGKGMRHVKVAKGAQIPKKQLAILIRNAVTLDRP